MARGKPRSQTTNDTHHPSRITVLRGAGDPSRERRKELPIQSDRFQAQNEALQQREREYRTLAENAPEVIARFDRRLRHTYINQYGARVYGVPAHDIIGKRSEELGMPADKVAYWNERFDEVFATGRQQTVDFEFDSPTFGHQYFSSLFVPEFDAQGQVASILAITRDVTEAKRAEEALRESEERFRAAYEQAVVGIEMLDLDGHLMQGNGWLAHILGYREEELQPHTFAEITHPEDLRKELPLQKRLLAGEIRSYSIEKRYLHKDGHPVWVRVTSSLVHASTLYRISIIEDITERKRNEEALRILNTTLESKVAQRTAELERRTHQLQKLAQERSAAEERERKRLAELLHDDLQQQLAAAKFHLGLLGRQIKKEDADLLEATKQVEAMLREAIEKSRKLSHELSPPLLYRGDFGETLEWLASQIQAKHGLVVHVEIYGRIQVWADPIKVFLFRAAQEILFNTVKHAQAGEATMRLQRRRGQLWLTISDRGQGFDPKALEQTAGFGLLSIRERVELLGGRMKIRSAPGRGSTFLLTVPDNSQAQDRERQAENGEATAESGVPFSAVGHPPSTSRLRVLLADDHEVMREGLATLLNEQTDIEVIGQAADGREAVELAQELRPDVVVMDVAMPVMDGEEATRQIRRRIPRTRVVGLSMFDEPTLIEKMHQAGAERYMLKTAPAEELLAAIRER